MSHYLCNEHMVPIYQTGYRLIMNKLFLGPKSELSYAFVQCLSVILEYFPNAMDSVPPDLLKVLVWYDFEVMYVIT